MQMVRFASLLININFLDTKLTLNHVQDELNLLQCASLSAPVQCLITSTVLSGPQLPEYTTFLQSILLRSIVDGDKLDIEAFPTIANATIIAIMVLKIILISSVPYYSSRKICTDILVVGHLSSMSLNPFRSSPSSFSSPSFLCSMSSRTVTKPYINGANPKQMAIAPPIANVSVYSRGGLTMMSNVYLRPPTNIMIPRTMDTPASIIFNFIRIDTFGNWGLRLF